jgi:hypothetical protein
MRGRPRRRRWGSWPRVCRWLRALRGRRTPRPGRPPSPRARGAMPMRQLSRCRSSHGQRGAMLTRPLRRCKADLVAPCDPHTLCPGAEGGGLPGVWSFLRAWRGVRVWSCLLSGPLGSQGLGQRLLELEETGLCIDDASGRDVRITSIDFGAQGLPLHKSKPVLCDCSAAALPPVHKSESYERQLLAQSRFVADLTSRLV